MIGRLQTHSFESTIYKRVRIGTLQLRICLSPVKPSQYQEMYCCIFETPDLYFRGCFFQDFNNATSMHLCSSNLER